MSDAHESRRPVIAELREAFHQNRDLERLRSLWSQAPGATLDLGTGAGRIALALAGFGVAVIGIDLDAFAIEAARRRATERALRVNFTAADARSYIADGRFSWIVACSFLEHIVADEDVERILSNARAMLAPGGSMVLTLVLDAFRAGLIAETRADRRIVMGAFCERIVEIKEIATDRVVYSLMYRAPTLSVEQRTELVLRLRTLSSFLEIVRASGFRVRQSFDGTTGMEATPLSPTAMFILN
ncbi:MAG TPA: class I SAM-dependent methyltransferase [Methylocystis sp.]|nr:class I SAM-dependent methyltransferase [Methylocystis sp.]